jgi:hypothetical protein
MEKPQIINPPNRLRERVTGSGPISEEMLARAEAAVESLSAQFGALMASQIAELDRLQAEGAAASSTQQLATAKRIFEIVHDLRGQAGTFDYPLITRIGSSLCRFTENLTECDARCYEVIRVHIEAMDAVLHNALHGDGGPLGEAIAGGLETAVKKILS